MIIIARTSDAPVRQAQACRPVVFLIEKQRGTLPHGRARARRSPRSAISAGRPGSSPSTIAACPAERLIGEEGQAFYYATSGLETARAHTAARAIGLARGALDDSITPTPASAAVRPARSATSRRSASRSPAWRPRSRRRASSLLRLRADRHRPALRQGSLDGEALRLGDGRARVQRGHPDPSAARATRRCTPSSATGATRG